MPGFLAPVETTHIALWSAVADFNNDGRADLALETGAPGFTVRLSNGDGTFQAPRTTVIGGGLFTLGDFNGDRKPDVAAQSGDVLLGNGDGTFHQGPKFSLPHGQRIGHLAAADFNHDGRPDLAVMGAIPVSGGWQSSVYWKTYANLLLSNGDGTFRATSTTLIDSKTPRPGRSLTVAEFTGDGNLDVLVGPDGDYFAYFGAGIREGVYLRNPAVFGIGQGAGYLLPGKGDGTFAHVQSYDIFSTAVADFNGDGTVDTLLNPDLVVAGDVNRNGMLDLVGDAGFEALIFVRLGNGDGTFQSDQLFFPPGSDYLAVGDFNGDGWLDVIVVNGYNDLGDHADTNIAVLLNDRHW